MPLAAEESAAELSFFTMYYAVLNHFIANLSFFYIPATFARSPFRKHQPRVPIIRNVFSGVN